MSAANDNLLLMLLTTSFSPVILHKFQVFDLGRAALMLLPLLPASQRALVGLHVARAQVPIASLALPIATGRSALAIAGVSGGLAVGAQARR